MIASQVILKELESKQITGVKSLAILLDPDNIETNKLSKWLQKIPQETDYIFVGGSRVKNGKTGQIVSVLKNLTNLPVILFPGNVNQITARADALLFLTLMSGENPEYLIRQQIKSVQYLRETALEIIPTAYILIDGGKTCTTEKVTNTKAIPQSDVQKIVDVALAGQYSGKKLIYLEAGSGANIPVNAEVISKVKSAVNIPLIVGGGIRTYKQRRSAYSAGADLVVMGTAYEE